MIHLVTFATDDMSRAAQLCIDSAYAHGVNIHARFTPGNIRHWEATADTVRENAILFDAPRGCGFWTFKPLILNAYMREAHDGDLVIWSDAGVEFINNVSHIIDRMDQDVFLFGNHWEHAHWCKRDIIDEIWPMGPGQLGPSWGRFGKQCQASVIFFRVSDYSRKFVKEWLDWCLFEGGRLIDDSPSRTPNHPEFQENRHDQAILTTMAYREGIKLHAWPAVYNRDLHGGGFTYPRDGYPESDNYPNLFFHHRRRNHEWSAAA